MRSKVLRSAVGCALASAAALAVTATAATKPLVLEDAKGDANGVNGQGAVTGADGQPGPGSQPDKDLSLLRLSATGGRTCTGYTATLELLGPPSSNTVYRVLGTTRTNTSVFGLQYNNNLVEGTTSWLLYSDGNSPNFVDLATPAKVDGSKITLTVTEADLKAANEKLLDFTFLAPRVESRSSGGMLAMPLWDVLPNKDKNFKPCG